jgi:pyridoxamine 5'-phosphate oxidase
MNLGKNLADLRKSYEREKLDEADVAQDPLEQFTRWMQQAIDAQIPEPNAMTLATVSKENRPSTRPVLIKGCDERGIVWYTNYESRKARQISKNPWASLQFHWVELERVVRIEGKVEKVSPEESEAYYRSRPLDSRIAAWASPQSEVIADRKALEKRVEEFNQKFGENPPLPPNWGGLRLVPERWEFWQGRKNRLHDRIVYRREKGNWLRERLAP